MKATVLEIKSLHAWIGEKQILRGIDLTVLPGEVHAIMGPNGSGKSTLASALLGHPAYRVGGNAKITLGNENVLTKTTTDRAKSGLFLAFQSPIAVSGVSVMNLLRSGYQEIHGTPSGGDRPKVQNPVLARRWNGGGVSMKEFIESVNGFAKQIRLNPQLLSRSINDGFSGGEKKKVEMLSALVLSPKVAIFDEIDTGLDVDALASVSAGIELLRKGGAGVLIITHYQRILKYVRPHMVHILVGGKIVKSGDWKLAKTVEKEGYKKYV
jgi:Fe-S cluster assembly ATP-binding protein